jgi:hypothetical protein
MVEVERIINFIIESRKRGFRDDFIKKSLMNKGYPENLIYDAFAYSGRPKRIDIRSRGTKTYDKSKTSITILVNPSVKKALEKKAEKDGLTLNNEIRKILINSVPSYEIPKGININKMIRKKPKNEDRKQHNRKTRIFRARLERERRKKVRILRRMERRGRK